MSINVKDMPLRDNYGRPVDSLRLIITTRCNYQCIFCHREGLEKSSGNIEERLRPKDYGFLASIARKINIKFYKITGGEPLLRRDVHEIVREIRPYAEEVSITTNGSLLCEKAELLAESGVDRVNVSLHSLREDTYRYLTGGVNLLDSVLKGLETSLGYGLKVKLNFLAMKSNISEFPQILQLAEKYGFDLNVIELIPLGTPIGVYKSEHVKLDPIVEFLEKIAVKKTVRIFQSRPIYVLPSGTKVEVVIGYGNPHLCSSCTRLRFTPEGYLKTCLYVEYPFVDVYNAIIARDEIGVLEGFKRAISLRKPFFKSR